MWTMERSPPLLPPVIVWPSKRSSDATVLPFTGMRDG